MEIQLEEDETAILSEVEVTSSFSVSWTRDTESRAKRVFLSFSSVTNGVKLPGISYHGYQRESLFFLPLFLSISLSSLYCSPFSPFVCENEYTFESKGGERGINERRGKSRDKNQEKEKETKHQIQSSNKMTQNGLLSPLICLFNSILLCSPEFCHFLFWSQIDLQWLLFIKRKVGRNWVVWRSKLSHENNLRTFFCTRDSYSFSNYWQ